MRRARALQVWVWCVLPVTQTHPYLNDKRDGGCVVERLFGDLHEAMLAAAAGWDGVCPHLQRCQRGGITSVSAPCLQDLRVHTPADGHNC